MFGLFETRADAVVHFVLAVNLFTPLGVIFAIRAAKARDFVRHKWMQAGFFALCIVAVTVLEVKIRMGGGSGSLVAGSPHAGTSFMKAVLLTHVAGAFLSYALWGYLVVASWRRFDTALPGAFSKRHKLLAKIVFVGLLFDACSASAMYYFGFVAV